MLHPETAAFLAQLRSAGDMMDPDFGISTLIADSKEPVKTAAALAREVGWHLHVTGEASTSPSQKSLSAARYARVLEIIDALHIGGDSAEAEQMHEIDRAMREFAQLGELGDDGPGVVLKAIRMWCESRQAEWKRFGPSAPAGG